MTNIVMAIALWCSVPSERVGMTAEKVNKCREELFVCVEKDPNGNKFLDCFKKKKL